MNITDLINQYLKDKQRDFENDYLNIVDEQIHTWNFTYVPQPTMEELLEFAPQAQAEINQEIINAEALRFLKETDYYVIRFQETGQAIPENILAERAFARKSITK